MFGINKKGRQHLQKKLLNVTKKYMAERKANPALLKPMALTADLEAVVGKGPMPRSQVVKKLWEYIKKNDLQNPANKRNIMADEKLKKVFGGKGEVNMFEMTKLVSKHLS
jgi:chromatin remodeling complex protein RSC6